MATLDHLSDLLPSWERSLRARGLAQRTVTSYLASANEFIAAQGDPAVATLRRDHIEDHIDRLLRRTSPSNAATAYRRLQQLCRWLAIEGEIAEDPMRRMSPPHIPERPVPVIGENTMRRLLAACDGNTFVDRRDTAVIRFLVDTGVRAGELVGIRVSDVDWSYGTVTVTGKGGKVRSCPFGAKTSEALDRYLRMRRHHRFGDSPMLWLGVKGPLSASGVTQLLERRCVTAGIPAINPHRFRHTFAHEWLAAGGSEQDLERLAGWSSRSAMGRRYGASAADQRARDAHRRLGLADRL